jgi:predicted RNase H-like HicB family nuclease
MKTYIFPVDIEEEEDGRWSADIPALPGCAVGCYPREHVLESLQEAAQMMLEYGDPLPEGIDKYELDSTVEVPQGSEVVTVTL